LTAQELLRRLTAIAATDPTTEVLIDFAPVRRLEQGTVAEGMELIGGRWIERKWLVKGKGTLNLESSECSR